MLCITGVASLYVMRQKVVCWFPLEMLQKAVQMRLQGSRSCAAGEALFSSAGSQVSTSLSNAGVSC
jgi:hypothetical protein